MVARISSGGHRFVEIATLPKIDLWCMQEITNVT